MWSHIQNSRESKLPRGTDRTPKIGDYARPGLTERRERNFDQKTRSNWEKANCIVKWGSHIQNSRESGVSSKGLEVNAWVNSKMGPPGGNTKQQSFEGSADEND